MDTALSLLDGNDGAGSCVNGVALNAAPIAEYKDDFFVVLCANDGLHPLDPVSQSLPVAKVRVCVETVTAKLD